MSVKVQQALPLGNVTINDGFWSELQNRVIDVVLPYQKDILEDQVPGAEKSHAIQNFRIAAGDAKGEFHGMVFQDSDVAKWLEAVAYALHVRPDPELVKKADEVIDIIGRAQQPDGYLNTYFIVKEPDRKWQNLQECHELYCAGHMIEAAVAYYESTGKDNLLNIMRKKADLICQRFGHGKTQGIPGHQEIELALTRLYHVTGEKSYLETAMYFLDERGKSPSFFAEEIKRRGWNHWRGVEDPEYSQNHLPVREQTEAVGHSVRAVYMYAGMAAVAAETNDQGLIKACRNLWENIVNKRMYITGGIGSTHHGEAFTKDYDLPNDTIYAETCASIAMVFFARHMLELTPKSEYADNMELQLYNGALSGMQLDGKRFFYVNPLEVVPGISGVVPGKRHVLPTRPEWYTCACCPPNVSRLITSLGQYAWGENEKGVFGHLYLGGTANCEKAEMKIECESNYPWCGNIGYTVTKAPSQERFFAVRIPAWCCKWAITINGSPAKYELQDGYAYITRNWQSGDKVALSLTIEPRRVYANTRVRANAGCVALMCGPLVYCLEETDNGPDLSALRLPRGSKLTARQENIPSIGDVVVLEAEGTRNTSCESLYSQHPPESKPANLHAVPYYTWGNRESGGMRVWIHE
ncbi:MAG: glycoside hydrolase family 127 protein [Defluviitaleaceae bacterium]|nr:glycoside hydrolase family 127 protein [Defluviitaleaceae bacterium]